MSFDNPLPSDSPIRFESPWLLLSLVVLVGAVVLWRLAERRRMRYAVEYTNLDVLATVVSGRSWSRLIPPALFGLALASLLVALARPHVDRMFLKERATVILVVDTSRSMQAEDVEPTRLGAAQQAIKQFLDQAPDRLNVGLVVFAGEAQVATPPTKDRRLVETAVDAIGTYVIFGGTAIGDALDAAVNLGKTTLEQEDPPEGKQITAGSTRQLIAFVQATTCEEESPVSILFLSDGAQTRGVLQPLEGAERARNACFPVHTIALGTPEGVIDRGSFGPGFSPPDDSGANVIPVPPDPETLRRIAEMTGGEFSEARSAEALENAYENVGSKLGREPGESEVTFILVAIAAALLLAALALGTFLAARLP